MALLRYRAEEAANIAKAEKEAARQAALEGSLAVSKASSTITVTSLGLDQVDNTSDVDKPVSNATQTALDLKANASDLAVKLEWTTVPATAASTGTAGQIAYDGSFLYVCVATDTWVRAALTTW